MFTILWVEDKQRVINLNKRELEQLFAESYKDFELCILPATNKRDIEYATDKHIVDIIVTDYNLEENWDGIDVINLISRKRLPIDILFYTAVGQGPTKADLFAKTKYYGFIEISYGTKEIFEPIKKLIQKNLRRCSDIVFLRGLVVSKMIDLELKINELFEKYFRIPPETSAQFHSFLENSYLPMSGKKKTCSKLFRELELRGQNGFDGIIDKIGKLDEERNLLAHCKTDVNRTNVLISWNGEQTFDKKRINKIIKKTTEVSQKLDELITRLSPK